MKHEPFTLICRVATPIVVPRYAIHLDALLWYCVGVHTNSSDSVVLKSKLDQLLKFSEDSQTYCASSMIGLVTPSNGVAAKTVSRVDYLSPEKLTTSEQVFIKNKRLIVVGGPTKKRLTQRQAITVPYVAFHGVGDAGKCAQYLSYYLQGLGEDSQTSGGGEITQIDVIRHDDDCKWYKTDDDYVARNLPSEFCKKMGLEGVEQPVVVSPPYYSKRKVMGYCVERIQVEPLQHLLGDTYE